MHRDVQDFIQLVDKARQRLLNRFSDGGNQIFDNVNVQGVRGGEMGILSTNKKRHGCHDKLGFQSQSFNDSLIALISVIEVFNIVLIRYDI
jgi:hypothetical protein